MRRVLITIWLLMMIPLLALCLGPGQKLLAMDEISHQMRQAQFAGTEGNWKQAVKTYDGVVRTVPSDRKSLLMQIRIARCEALFQDGQAIAALTDLEELQHDAITENWPAELRTRMTERLGSMYYRTAWIMRLNGARNKQWMDVAERSRQCWRYLAESTLASPVSGATLTNAEYRKNMELVIELERMNLDRLRIRPRPEGQSGGETDSAPDDYEQAEDREASSSTNGGQMRGKSSSKMRSLGLNGAAGMGARKKGS